MIKRRKPMWITKYTINYYTSKNYPNVVLKAIPANSLLLKIISPKLILRDNFDSFDMQFGDFYDAFELTLEDKKANFNYLRHQLINIAFNDLSHTSALVTKNRLLNDKLPIPSRGLVALSKCAKSEIDTTANHIDHYYDKNTRFVKDLAVFVRACSKAPLIDMADCSNELTTLLIEYEQNFITILLYKSTNSGFDFEFKTIDFNTDLGDYKVFLDHDMKQSFQDFFYKFDITFIRFIKCSDQYRRNLKTINKLSHSLKIVLTDKNNKWLLDALDAQYGVGFAQELLDKAPRETRYYQRLDRKLRTKFKTIMSLLAKMNIDKP